MDTNKFLKEIQNSFGSDWSSVHLGPEKQGDQAQCHQYSLSGRSKLSTQGGHRCYLPIEPMGLQLHPDQEPAHCHVYSEPSHTELNTDQVWQPAYILLGTIKSCRKALTPELRSVSTLPTVYPGRGCLELSGCRQQCCLEIDASSPKSEQAQLHQDWALPLELKA